MKKYTVDLKGVLGPADLHKRIGRTLSAPEYYGNNLDALHDLLSEMTEAAEIRFEGMQDMMRIMPGTYRRLEYVIADAVTENEALQIAFIM